MHEYTYIAINRKAYIFYVCVYTHTNTFCMSVHTFCNYYHCAMWLGYQELWEHINFSRYLHLWHFLHCVQMFWCHTFLHSLLPLLLLSNRFPKAEFRNYDKFIFKYSWKVSRGQTWYPLNLQVLKKSDPGRTTGSVIKTCRSNTQFWNRSFHFLPSYLFFNSHHWSLQGGGRSSDRISVLYLCGQSNRVSFKKEKPWKYVISTASQQLKKNILTS